MARRSHDGDLPMIGKGVKGVGGAVMALMRDQRRSNDLLQSRRSKVEEDKE